jgi:LysR family transcriptional regulator, carnitine catabolism transcriptional activator
MSFKLRQLEGFVAACRLPSFSAAARRLAMTQPAFSQSIRELETRLGVALFERTTRKVTLTEAGQRLLALIERPLSDLSDAHKLMREMASGSHGSIALSSPALGFMTSALARFKAGYPTTRVRLFEDQNPVLIHRVLDREVDFGIGTLNNPAKELAFRELMRDELMVVYHARHALRNKRKITWRDLAAERLILLPKHSGVRDHTDRGLAASGIPYEPEYEVASMVMALSIVRVGLGVTLVPRIMLGELNMKGLRASPVAEPHPARSLGVITRADRPLSPAASAFVDLLFAATRSGARQNRK